VLRVLDDRDFLDPRHERFELAAPTDPRAASDWPKRHRYSDASKSGERELAEQVIESKRLLESRSDLRS